MRKKQKQKLFIGIMVILLVGILVYNGFKPLSIFDSPIYIYSTNTTLLGHEAIAKSTYNFGEGTIGEGNQMASYRNLISDNGMDLQGFSAEQQGGSSFKTIIATTNLKINISKLDKLIITYNYNSNMNSESNTATSITGGEIYLINKYEDSDISLVQFPGLQMSANPTTSQVLSETAILKKFYGSLCLETSSGCNNINIPEGEYEILIKGNVNGGYPVFSNNQKLFITRLEYSELTPITPTTYYRLQNNTCNQITISSSQKTSDDFLSINDCTSNITQPPITKIPSWIWWLVGAIGILITIISLKLFFGRKKRRR
jgi:hypothetical protein